MLRTTDGWGDTERISGAGEFPAPAVINNYHPGPSSSAPQKRSADFNPQLMTPFAVDKIALKIAAYEYLAGGAYTADDLIRDATIEKFEMYYVPVYLFTGTYAAEWTASFGDKETESYIVHEAKTVDGKKHVVPVEKQRTFIRWYSARGEDDGNFTVICYAGAALDDVLKTFIEAVPDRQMIPYDGAELSHCESEPCAVAEVEAYKSRGMAQVNEIIFAGVRRHKRGDHQADWRWTATIEKSSRSAMIPICHVSFVFSGNTYNLWVDGADAFRRSADELPQDNARYYRVKAGFWLAWLLTASLPGFGLVYGAGFFSGMNKQSMGAVAVAWLYAYWRKHAILTYSKGLRQATLAYKVARVRMEAGEDRHALYSQPIRFPEKPWVERRFNDNTILFVLISAVFIIILKYTDTSTLDVAKWHSDGDHYAPTEPVIRRPPDPPADSGADAAVQPTPVQSAKADLPAAEQKLKETYKLALATLHHKARAHLRSEQRAWAKKSKAYCKGITANGDGSQDAYADCLLAETENRTEEIKKKMQ